MRLHRYRPGFGAQLAFPFQTIIVKRKPKSGRAVHAARTKRPSTDQKKGRPRQVERIPAKSNLVQDDARRLVRVVAVVRFLGRVATVARCRKDDHPDSPSPSPPPVTSASGSSGRGSGSGRGIQPGRDGNIGNNLNVVEDDNENDVATTTTDVMIRVHIHGIYLLQYPLLPLFPFTSKQTARPALNPAFLPICVIIRRLSTTLKLSAVAAATTLSGYVYPKMGAR